MSNNFFTPKDVIAAKAKCVDTPWLKVEPTKTRKSQSKQNPTFYIPITARNITGKYIPLALSFGSQVIASSAKPPFGVEPAEAKDVRILFRELSREDFEPTEYNEAKIEGLLANNKEFIAALNIIADEYVNVVESDVLTYKGDKFKLTKTRTINSFRQTHRNAGENDEGDEDGKVALPVPLYRLKLPADAVTKRIGISATEKTEHQSIVFDMKKGTSRVGADGKSKYTHVVAKIRTSSGYVDLTISNVKNFITYMSLVGGKVVFDSICISKAGISLMCKIRELHVMRHPHLKVDAMDENTVNDMRMMGADLGDADDEIMDEPVEDAEAPPRYAKSNNKFNNKPSKKAVVQALDNDDDDEVVVGNDEPDENNIDEDELPPAKKQSAKNAAKPVEKHDEEDETTEQAEENEGMEELPKKKMVKGKPTTGGNPKAGARRKKD